MPLGRPAASRRRAKDLTLLRRPSIIYRVIGRQPRARTLPSGTPRRLNSQRGSGLPRRPPESINSEPLPCRGFKTGLRSPGRIAQTARRPPRRAAPRRSRPVAQATCPPAGAPQSRPPPPRSPLAGQPNGGPSLPHTLVGIVKVPDRSNDIMLAGHHRR